jgi:hypothetical protein
MTKTLIFALFLGLFPAFGQEITSQPATKQDVENQRRELNRLRRELKGFQENSAKQSKTENDRVVGELTKAITDRDQALQDSIRRQAEESEKSAQLRTMRIVMGLLGVAVLYKKVQTKKIQAEVERLMDPTIPELKVYAKEHKTNRIPLVIHTDDGRRFKCTAILDAQDKFKKLIYDGTGVETENWRERYNVAKSIPPQKVRTA